MKTMKKLFALIMALAMVMALAVTVSATEGGDDPAPAVTAKTGSGSITVKNATKGQEYKAYLVFDATITDDGKISYTTPAANASKLDNTLFGWSTAADKNGNIAVWALENVADADIIAWVEANYADFAGANVYDGEFDAKDSTVTFSNLPYGYYFITSTLGAEITIDSTKPTAEVYDKNETEPVDPVKTIVSVDGTAVNDLTETDAHVGSVVGFKLVGKTNNWIDKDTIRTEWTVTDTPTSMEIDLSSVVVKFNDTELTEDQYTAVIENGKLTITVPMTDANGNSLFEATQENNGLIPIEITYNATITKDAGSTPAKNEIPGSNIVIKTYELKLSKVDGDNKPLAGAVFQVLKDGTPLTFIEEGDTYTYCPADKAPEGVTLVTDITMTENTTVLITGLDKWDLVVKETVVPDGYNQAEDTNVAKTDLSEVGTESASIKEVTVINRQGAELPSTGGIGTTIFTVVGATLMIGAAVLFITKKRSVID